MAASTTASSTVSKSGTDEQTGSVVQSGGDTGSAHPGDTVDWVLSYQNNTGKVATVTVNDPITAGHSLVAGTLKQPPGWNVTASGSLVSGSAAAVLPASGAAMTFQAGGNALNQPSGGDGFNVVIDTQNPANVYTAFHHTYPSIACVNKTAGGACTGWPASVLYFDPSNPTGPLPTSVPAGDPLVSNWANWTSIDQATGYVFETVAAPNTTSEVLCYDTRARKGCGIIQPTPGIAFGMQGIGGANAATGPTEAADGNIYWTYYTSAGAVIQRCFVPATGATCAAGDGVQLMPTGTVLATTVDKNTLAFGRYVFSVYQNSSSGHTTMQCYDTSTQAICAGWPAAGPTSTNVPGPNLASVTDASGNVTGICALSSYSPPQQTCFSLAGASISAPTIYNQSIGEPATTVGSAPGYFQEVAQIGSKTYVYQTSTATVQCFDFSTNAACAGFSYTGPNLQSAFNYTLHVDDANPTCLWADGNNGNLIPINAITGGVGCSIVGTVTATPQSNYCDGGSHPITWTGVNVAAPPSTQFGQFVVTVKDATGRIVTDSSGNVWSNRLVPSTTRPIDLSAILYGPSVVMSGNTYDTTTLTVQIGFNNVTAAFNPPPAATLSWSSDNNYQVCFKTTVDNTCATFTVANNATFVTDATAAGGTSDGPAGNSTGAASYSVTPTAATCMLHLSKVPSPQEVKPGQPVTYAITITNAGTANYTAASPAVVNDGLTNPLTEATYDNDAAVSPAGSGAVSYTSPTLNWTGPLAAGASVSVTYTMTAKAGAGGSTLTNSVTSPDVTNCPAAGTTDAACTATDPIQPVLTIAKTADPAGPVPHGTLVTYRVTISNPDDVAYTGAQISDNLSGVLDVASLTGTTTSTVGSASVTGNTLTWSGDIPAHGTATITYQVTVN